MTYLLQPPHLEGDSSACCDGFRHERRGHGVVVLPVVTEAFKNAADNARLGRVGRPCSSLSVPFEERGMGRYADREVGFKRVRPGILPPQKDGHVM